jgi:hypothetical protein
MADETPAPLEKPALVHLSGGIRVQREPEVRFRWINRVPAQIAILLIAISALLGMVAQWQNGRSDDRTQRSLLQSNAALQTTVAQLQHELETVSNENECRSRYSIEIQTAQGNLSANIGLGLAAVLRRDPNRDPNALAQALDDTSQAVLRAVASRQQTEAVCANKTGDHP